MAATDPKRLVADGYDRIAAHHAAWAATVRTEERVGDMAQIELPDESFDAVAAFYSIIHLPREEHAALFARIARWLRPDGLFVAALGMTDNPAGYEDNWLGAPMFWSGFDRQTSERLIEAAGLRIEGSTIETADEDGEPVSLLWIHARHQARPLQRRDDDRHPTMSVRRPHRLALQEGPHVETCRRLCPPSARDGSAFGQLHG